ncbi:IS1 family transposase [Xylophilus sp. ASV27]|uniref:IS1 family transposase n=1 Tax=Xylophilus sp. ASV27 TaxID=2795129 RepID=UPI00351C1A31
MLGDRGAGTARVLQQQLPALPQARHIEYCSDHHRPYLAILSGRRHTVGKAHTHHIESMNNKLRCYLARLRRKTHAYSKSATALLHSLLFIWRRKFAAPLQAQTGCIESPRLWDRSIDIPI